MLRGVKAIYFDSTSYTFDFEKTNHPVKETNAFLSIISDLIEHLSFCYPPPHE